MYVDDVEFVDLEYMAPTRDFDNDYVEALKAKIKINDHVIINPQMGIIEWEPSHIKTIIDS